MNHEYLLHMNCPPLRTDFYLYLKNSQFILVLSLNSLNLVSKKKNHSHLPNSLILLKNIKIHHAVDDICITD